MEKISTGNAIETSQAKYQDTLIFRLGQVVCKVLLLLLFQHPMMEWTAWVGTEYYGSVHH